MPAITLRASTRVRIGRAFTALPIAFLVFDIVIKLLSIAPVTESFTRLGWPPDVARQIGVLELMCLVIYLVPRTAIIGAVLLTGFLGGAIATHVRVDDPLFSHELFPMYVAVLLWIGLFLRDARVAAIVAAGEHLLPSRSAVTP